MLIRVKGGDYRAKADSDFFQSLSRENHIIALDFDGVFSSSHGQKARNLRESGYSIRAEDTCSFRMASLGIPREVYVQTSMRAYIDQLLEAPTEPELDKFWPKLRDLQSVTIYLVTSRFTHMLDVMVAYLNAKNIDVAGIFNVNDTNKKGVLKLLRPIVYVDDSAHKLYELFEDPETCQVPPRELTDCDFVLFRNVANAYEGRPRGLIKDLCGGWAELYSYLHIKVMAKSSLFGPF